MSDCYGLLSCIYIIVCLINTWLKAQAKNFLNEEAKCTLMPSWGT